MEQIALAPVDRVEITTLCENLVDMAAPPREGVERLGSRGGPKLVSQLRIEERSLPFEGAQGLSMLVKVTANGITRSVLFDTGGSPDGLIHNLDCLELSPKDWSCIVLSHGHFDHVLGLIGLQQRLKRLDFPVTLHPDAFLNRRVESSRRGGFSNIGAPSRQGLRDAGMEMIETERPSFVLENLALVTGQVARTTSFEVGWPRHQAERNGAWEPDPLICDDQGLVLNVKGKGLIVLTGCGHAGIINTVSYAQAITGVTQVHAVIGGFHLGEDFFQSQIPAVVEEFVKLRPAVLAPAHCAGYRASFAIYQALPDAFVQNTVGTRIVVEGSEN